jgi:selenocysteine lyase/cysteine desulfurase
MPAFDLAHVRAQFPAFAEPSLDGWAHFETAGGSYACAPVIDRLATFYRRLKVQPHAPYPASTEGGAWMDESRARLSAWLGVGPDELHFGPSTSQNAYVLAHAFRAGWAEGDAIIVTNQDHEANSGAWRRLEATGLEVREWRVDDAGSLRTADLDRLLDDRVKLVAFTHCSNIVAEINPVADWCARIRAAGAVSVVDGVSYAPHGLPDVAGLGADVYLFSAYKTYGPHLGIMTVRAEVAAGLANQSHYFNADDPRKRLVPAGPDHAQIAAAAGMVDYFEGLDARHHPGAAPEGAAARVHALIRAREQALLAPLLDYLRGRNDLRVLGPTDPARRAPTVAIALALPGEEAAARLADHKIMAGGGDFYARRLVEALGVDADHGVLRLSFTHYAAPEEIARAIAALDAL